MGQTPLDATVERPLPQHKRKQVMARQMAGFVGDLIEIWFKNAKATAIVPIGIVLTELSYTRNPWASVQYLAKRIPLASADTIRRRLEELVDDGLVESIEVDAKKLYRATPEAAEATMAAWAASQSDK